MTEQQIHELALSAARTFWSEKNKGVTEDFFIMNFISTYFRTTSEIKKMSNQKSNGELNQIAQEALRNLGDDVEPSKISILAQKALMNLDEDGKISSPVTGAVRKM